jgi:dolichol kinase
MVGPKEPFVMMGGWGMMGLWSVNETLTRFVLFLLPYQQEPFMHIAFSVGLAALIFLEYVRYFAVVPFGKEIHLFLVGFLDARDGGPIILSHLYLLMGCAAPVWLAEQHILAGLSGIFALGVGDAMASIVGKRFGRHRWPGTIKTVEGTIAFVLSVMIAAGTVFVGMWIMSFAFGNSSSTEFAQTRHVSSSSSVATSSSPFIPAAGSSSVVRPASLSSLSTWEDWSAVSWSVWGVVRYAAAVSIAAMLEAVSEQNDNLVIPVVMLSMVWLV